MRAARFANGVLILGSIVMVLAFAWVVVVFDILLLRGFGGPLGKVLYHLLPLLGAGLLLACLKLPAERRVALVITLISSAIGLYAIELILTTTNLSSRLSASAQRAGAEFDDRSRIQTILDLRAEGHDAYPNVNSQGAYLEGLDVFTLAGLPDKVVLFSNESGTWHHYRSDERGFNNPKGLWGARRIDIAFIGDSFTEGYAAPAGEGFVDHVRREYRATLNAGKAGQGLLAHLGTLREFLTPVEPPLVLWVYYEGNDLCETRVESGRPKLAGYLDPDFFQDLDRRTDEIAAALIERIDASLGQRGSLRGLADVVGFVTLRQLRLQLGITSGTPTGVYDKSGCVFMDANPAWHLDALRPEDEQRVTRILELGAERVRAWGGELWFVYLPEWQRYNEPSLAEPNRDRIIELAGAAGLPIIDLHHAFAAHEDPLSLFPFRKTPHYNDLGHRLVARVLLEAIAARRARQ